MGWNSLRISAVVATLAAAFFLPSTACAGGEWGISAFAGYNTYAMSDLNDEVIGPINLLLAGTGYSMDEVSGGLGFGGGLRYRTPGNIMIGVDFERLGGSTDLSVPGGSFEIKTAANAFTGTIVYYFPSASRARFGLGAGLGFYSSAGEVTLFDDVTLEEDTEDLEGSGVGFHGVGALDLTLSSSAHLEANVGYRFAKTTDLEIAGTKQTTSDGDDATLDWSGLMTRVGFTFYFGAK